MEDEREIRSELLPVAGRVVMMSGGSSGIGAAIARRLRREGYRLSLAAVNPDVTYHHIEMWIDTGNSRPVKAKFYTETDRSAGVPATRLTSAPRPRASCNSSAAA